MWILGLNAPPLGWHDSSACLVDGDGRVWALVEEERISRKKHALHDYPINAVRACLDLAGISACDVDVVALGWDLPRHYGRTDLDKVDPPVPGRPFEFGDDREFVRAAAGWQFAGRRMPDVRFVSHHLAHASASFHASAWPEAAVLVVDGNGDDESISIFEARRGAPLVCRERWPLSHSIGYMYDAVSRAIGLSFLDAGKTMGLAAYGRAMAIDPVPLLEVSSRSFAPRASIPDNATYDEIAACWDAYFRAAGLACDPPASERLHENTSAVRLAWSGQVAVEQAMLALAERAREVTGLAALCLGGGVALNCSTNGLMPEPVFVPPVPHDAGVALGAAWVIAPPRVPRLLDAYMGTAASYRSTRHPFDLSSAMPLDVADVADRLERGHMGAIVCGRAEIGPRALCHRSLIALPSSTEVRNQVNRVKGRELWRPLAPVGLAEAEGILWSASEHLHRYMLGAATVTDAGRAAAPAMVHVDGTARPQVVGAGELVEEILIELRHRGLGAVLINTSLNDRSEPVVNSYDDALSLLARANIGFAVLDDVLVART